MNFTEEQIIKIKQNRKVLRCNHICGAWNSEDQDCEIYGWDHPSPRICPTFGIYDGQQETLRQAGYVKKFKDGNVVVTDLLKEKK